MASRGWNTADQSDWGCDICGRDAAKRGVTRRAVEKPELVGEVAGVQGDEERFVRRATVLDDGDGAVDDDDQAVVDRPLLREDVAALPGAQVHQAGEHPYLVLGQGPRDRAGTNGFEDGKVDRSHGGLHGGGFRVPLCPSAGRAL